LSQLAAHCRKIAESCSDRHVAGELRKMADEFEHMAGAGSQQGTKRLI